MMHEEKIKWLKRVFSNNPRVRREAMEENIPQPLFKNAEQLRKAIDELRASVHVKQFKTKKGGKK